MLRLYPLAGVRNPPRHIDPLDKIMRTPRQGPGKSTRARQQRLRQTDQSFRGALAGLRHRLRSEEHTSELQSLMRISYAVFCLKKKTPKLQYQYTDKSYIYKHNIIQHYTTQSSIHILCT